MASLNYGSKLRRVDISKVKTIPEASNSLDYKLMLATFYDLYEPTAGSFWERERIKGTWSHMYLDKLNNKLLIEQRIITKEELLKNTGESRSYLDRANQNLNFAFLLRGKGILDYLGYESILLLIDDNPESIFDYDELVKSLVIERFKCVFYVKNDSALLIDVEELRKKYWRDRSEENHN